MDVVDIRDIFEVGDYVEIGSTSGDKVHGEIIKIGSDSLVIRNNQGLKAVFNVSKIESIAQFDKTVAPPMPAQHAQGTTENSVPREVITSVDAKPRSIVPENKMLSILDEFGYVENKEQQIQALPAFSMEMIKTLRFDNAQLNSRFQGIYTSVNFALTNDKTAIDDKVDAAVRKLKDLYRDFEDAKLLQCAAFLMTLHTPKRVTNKNHFFDAAEMLLSIAGEDEFLKFVVSNGTLPFSLSIWQKVINAPHFLYYTFLKAFQRTSHSIEAIKKSVDEIFASAMYDNKVKNILLFSLLKALNPECTVTHLDCSSQELLEEIQGKLSDQLTFFSDKGYVIRYSSDDGSGMVLTEKMNQFSFSSHYGLTIGDYVLFTKDKRDEVQINNVLSKETKSNANLQKLFAIMCTFSVTDRVFVQTKEYVRSLLNSRQTISVDRSGKGASHRITDIRVLSKVQEGAKSVEEIHGAIAKTKEFVYQNPNNYTAILILLELLMRKICPQYDEAIKVFGEYKDKFSVPERVRLYRKIYDAFWATKQYSKARDIMGYIIKNVANPPFDHYIRIIQCYIQEDKYTEALKECERIGKFRASSQDNYASQLYVCRFLSYVGLKKKKEAAKELELLRKVSLSIDKYEELKTVLDDLENGRGKTVEPQIEDIVLDISTEVYKNILSELYTPFLKCKLETDEFDVVRQYRTFDVETKKWVLAEVENQNKAQRVYLSITYDKKYLFGNRTIDINPSLLKDAATSYLTMCHIAEFVLQKVEKQEWTLTMDETEQWKLYFTVSAARYFWLLYKAYASVHPTDASGTCLFYLKECLKLFASIPDTAKRISDYYDALNAYLMIASGQRGFSGIDIAIARTELAEYYLEVTEDEAKIANKTITENIMYAFMDVPHLVLKSMGGLIAQTPSYNTVVSELVIDAGIKVEDIVGILRDYIDINDDACVSESLMQYAESLSENYNRMEIAISEIKRAIRERNEYDLEFNCEKIREMISQTAKTMLFDEDIARCEEYMKLLCDQSCDSFAKLIGETIFDYCNRIYSNILLACQQLIQKYRNHPTEFAFLHLSELSELLLDASRMYKDNIAEKSVPVLSVQDDYEYEGYVPVNGIARLMLRVFNGRQGENCTTATNICIDIEPDKDDDKCRLHQTHYENVITRLQRGEDCAVSIEVPLTAKGTEPNTIFNLKLTLNYQTVNGQEKEMQSVVAVRIKGDEYAEIYNPYGVDHPIEPTGTNRHLFVGRDDDINNLSNSFINGEKGKTVIIYGQFRSGKSSLGKFLSAKIQEIDPHNIIVDNLTVMSDHNLNDIVDMIINAIIRKIKWKYHTVPEVLSEFRNIKTSASDYARIFVDFSVALKECIQTELPDLRILVVLDEFGRYLVEHANSTFAELWKSVMECNAFNAILIGHDSITRIIRENQNAFGIARLFHISYLSEEAAQRLITEPTAVVVNGEKKSRFIGNAVEYIWKQTGGNVFYLQTICQLAVDYMNTHRMSYINEIHIQRALRTYAEVTAPSDLELKGHPLFQSNDGDDGISDKENKMVLDAIVKTTEAKNGSTMKAIHEYLVSTYNKDALSEKRVKEVLFSLLSRKVITCSADGKYDIIVKFYGDYLNDTIIKELLLL